MGLHVGATDDDWNQLLSNRTASGFFARASLLPVIQARVAFAVVNGATSARGKFTRTGLNPSANAALVTS